MSILIPDGSALVSPQSFAEYTSGSKTGTKHQALVVCDANGNPVGDTSITGTITSNTGAAAYVQLPISSHATAIVLLTGTFSANLQFYGSNDGGTTWENLYFAVPGSGALGVSQGGSGGQYRLNVAGFNYVRAWAQPWTSGTVNVTIRATTDPGGLQFTSPLPAGGNTIGNVGLTAGSNIVGQVNALRPGTPVTFSATTAEAGVAPTASSALISLNVGRAGAATAAATTIALTAGKTLRVQSMLLCVSASTTTNIRVVATLRYNSGGSATASSPAVGQVVAGSPAAVAATGGQAIADFGDGLDLAAGATPAQIAVSIIGSTATGLCWVSLHGYEY